MTKRELQFTHQVTNPRGEEKLRNLILYIADKCALHKRFGTVKLNKILFWSDALSYAAHGEPITGVEYLAEEQGPVPRRMPAIREQMRARGQLAEQVRTVEGGFTEHRPVASEKADLSEFSGREIAIVDFVIEQTRRKTATDVSFWSHGRAWRIARKGTRAIPYEAAFLPNNSIPTEYEVSRGMELIRAHGWGR